MHLHIIKYILFRSLQLLDYLDNFQNNYLRSPIWMLQPAWIFLIYFLKNLWLNRGISIIWSRQNDFWKLWVLNYHVFHLYIFSSLIKTSHCYSHRIIYFTWKLTPAIHFSQVLQSIHLAAVGNHIKLKMQKQRPMPGSSDRKGRGRETSCAMPLRQVACCSHSTNTSQMTMLTQLPPPHPNSTAALSNSRFSPRNVL